MSPINRLIRQVLKEDEAFNDVTTGAVKRAGEDVAGVFIAKKPGVICGLSVAHRVFKIVDKACVFRPLLKDGAKVKKGRLIAEVKGPLRAVLAAERTALNFLGRLSGIATLTRRFVKRIRGTKAMIYDTRKTTPGLRDLEKYAVLCGGGKNHRMSLRDMALFKDNHLKLIDNLKKTVSRLKKENPGLVVEIECENMLQVRQAVEAGADIVMLDNMGIATMKRAIRLVRGFRKKSKNDLPHIEVSGGVNLGSVREFAKLGVDRISTGSITHSAPALDISMELQ
ncbi:MAG: carboxylating nicotinate-nucleotide diphosphorylase [Endomicrobiales bacterium]|nr:carboxylating nicotinate-nucleotide diphosphorylase [Endomicrobiales bacterium]